MLDPIDRLAGFRTRALYRVFARIPWYVYHEPILPWWLKTAIYSLVGGILLVLLTVAVEQRKANPAT